MPKDLRIGFCGSGPFAAMCLEMISRQHVKPEWVVTNIPRHSGRGMLLHRTPVDELSEQLGINCFLTEKFSADTDLIERIVKDSPDLILVIDFGHIIKEPILSLPRLGCLNIHPSKLPAYRGAAPVQRAIMDGLDMTAVTIFKLDRGMDSGPVLSQLPVNIESSDDTACILKKCAIVGTNELINVICDKNEDEWLYTPQSESGVSLAPKIDKSEGRIDWRKTSKSISCLIRAIGDTPGTYCMLGNKRLRIHKAEICNASGKPGTILFSDGGFPVIACGENAIKLVCVQTEGKKVQLGSDWFRGSRLPVGTELEQ